MKQEHYDVAFLALAVLGLLAILATLTWLGGVMLGTAGVGWWVVERRHRLSPSQLQAIEDYANKREEEA
jgi:hypothetical protein